MNLYSSRRALSKAFLQVTQGVRVLVGLRDLLSSLPRGLNFLWEVHTKEPRLQRAPLQALPGKGGEGRRDCSAKSPHPAGPQERGPWQGGAEPSGCPEPLHAGPVALEWQH